MYSKEHLFLSKLEDIRQMIDEKRPSSEIARLVGVKYETLTSYFKKYDITYKGNPNRKGIPHEENRVPLEKILNNEVTYSNNSLKKRLIECGLKENKCEICGITEWNGKNISFELHHIDGNHYNNNIDNLQVLCPNCHSQTETFRKTKNSLEKVIVTEDNKKIIEKIQKETSFEDNSIKEAKPRIKKEKKVNKEIEKKYCAYCGKELTNGKNKFCDLNCYNAYRAKNESKKPSVFDLMKSIEKYKGNKTSIGKHYGVSDNAIKKWMISYRLQ